MGDRYPVKSRAWEDNFFIKSGGFRASTLAPYFCTDHVGGGPRRKGEKRIKAVPAPAILDWYGYYVRLSVNKLGVSGGMLPQENFKN